MMVTFLGITATRTTITNSTPATDLIASHRMEDYSFLMEPFILDRYGVVLRCVTGLGLTSSQLYLNLGDWIFNGATVATGDTCGSVFQQRSANNNNFPGVINLYPCGSPLSFNEEGVYSCMIMNSLGIVQTTRVGLYRNGRSESLDMYPITSLLTIFHLSTQLLQ